MSSLNNVLRRSTLGVKLICFRKMIVFFKSWLLKLQVYWLRVKEREDKECRKEKIKISFPKGLTTWYLSLEHELSKYLSFPYVIWFPFIQRCFWPSSYLIPVFTRLCYHTNLFYFLSFLKKKKNILNPWQHLDLCGICYRLTWDWKSSWWLVFSQFLVMQETRHQWDMLSLAEKEPRFTTYDKN